MDDRGQDRSIEIAQSYALLDPRVRIHANAKNLRLLHARAAGAMACNSPWLLFLDADDFLAPETCEACYEALCEAQKQGHDLDFLVFNMKVQWKANDKYYNFGPIDKTFYYDKNSFIEILLDKKLYYWGLSNKMHRKEFYIQIYETYLKHVPQQVQMAEDLLTFAHMLFSTNHIQTLDKALYYYYYNVDSTMRAPKKEVIMKNIQDLKFVSSEVLKLGEKADFAFKLWAGLSADALKINILKEKYKMQKNIFTKKYYKFLIDKNEKNHKKLQNEALMQIKGNKKGTL